MRAPVTLGARVLLRPLEVADAPLLVRWLSDAVVTREIDKEPVTLEQERAFVERVAASPDLLASGIVLRESERLVGWIDLSLESDRKSASFGIVVGERDLWGQGIGTEATRLSLEIAFESLLLERVFLTVNETNRYAIRAYERVGFRRESVREKSARVAGELVDEWVMAIEPTEERGKS